MKITKTSVKKHARKIKDVSEEEFKELQENYEELMKSMQEMNAPGLLALSTLGIAIILIFDWAILDLLGLLLFAYTFYLFIEKEGHQEGYYEGYYDRMSKKKDHE